MKKITLQVSDQAAKRFQNMSEKEKELISKEIDRLVSNRKTLWEIMDDMSQQAQKNGWTPEILADMLEIDKEEMKRIMGEEK